MSRLVFALALAVGACVFAPGVGMAHHVAGGALPETIFDSLLSGLGHPVLGLDHMAFVLALGVAAAFTRTSLKIPVSFQIATATGVLAHYAQPAVAKLIAPICEPLIALSVMAVGALLLLPVMNTAGRWMVLALGAGIAHGWVYGEAIQGANTLMLTVYITGLISSQFMLMLVTKTFVDVMLADDHRIGTGIRVAGALLIAAGGVFLASSLA